MLTTTTHSKNITILGAGIAGLTAAYELKKLGYAVTVYEASNRVGGRILTKRFRDNPELIGELGAMRIPKQHRTVLQYIHAFGLSSSLEPFRSAWSNDRCFMDFGDSICLQNEAVNYLASTANLPAWSTKSALTRRYIAALKLIVDTISPLEIRTLFDQDLQKGLWKTIDDLLAQGLMVVPEDDLHPQRILRHISSLSGKWNAALQRFMEDILKEASFDLYQLRGGMDQIPSAFVQRIGMQNIKFGHAVSSIRNGKKDIEISFSNGKTIRADQVICTLPFSVLRTIPMSGISEGKCAAIRSMPYAPASKVLFLCRDRFWQHHPYHIKGGASANAQLTRQLYYPSVGYSDHVKAGVLLASYTIGKDSIRISNYIKSGDFEPVKQITARIHPEVLQPGMIQQIAAINWQDYPYALGGCSVMWDGEMDYSMEQKNTKKEQYVDRLHQDTIRPEGKLFFAGEHCSEQKAWIEGAMQSALDQVKLIHQYGQIPGNGIRASNHSNPQPISNH